jgi:hypothetical protein
VLSVVQLFVHALATQSGASALVQSALLLQVFVVPGVAWHAPFSQVKPVAHAAVAQLGTHAPSAQILLSPHSLEYLHVFEVAVHAPATQLNPSEQSLVAVQGHGPLVPPQASHLPSEVQVLPLAQSAFVVHCLVAPASVPGAEQTAPWQVSPFGQFASFSQDVAQPVAVQTDPDAQSIIPVQLACVGGATGEHP